ncbi:MAG: hypothetical protein ACYTFI_12555 [Planctomycetota bacterium]
MITVWEQSLVRTLVALVGVLVFICAVGCVKRGTERGSAPVVTPSTDVIVNISETGDFSVAGGRRTIPELLETVRLAAERSSPDEESFPSVKVVLDVAPGCPYARVRAALVACIRSRIWRVTFGVETERIEVDLPRMFLKFRRDEAGDPKDGDTAAAEVFLGIEYQRPEDWPYAQGERVLTPLKDGTARASVHRAGTVLVSRRWPSDVPKAQLLWLFWANSKGRVIHSATSAFPEDWPGIKVPLSLEGAHVVSRLAKTRCADMDELRRALTDMDSGTHVFVLPRDAVPFQVVFAAVRTCSRAGIKAVKLAPPPTLPHDGHGFGGWTRIVKSDLLPEWR